MGHNILLVEGPNDEHVMKHICGNRNVPVLDEVKPLGNVESLIEAFPVQLKAAGEGDVVGIVADADIDLGRRWQSIHDALVGVGYESVPDQPVAEGTILDAPADRVLPRAGVWLMPDNRTRGIMEDFLQFLVPLPSRLFDHVQKSVASISPADRRFRDAKESKAIIHTWLAWQKEPGMPLGRAISARFLDANVGQVDVLVSWLMRLFFHNSPHPSAP